MLFPTVQFGLFFPPVLVLSWVLMSRPRLWKPFIVVASYCFYAAADPLFCFLLAGVTLGNQAAALLMGRTDRAGVRKAIMITAVALDLLDLGVFKYYGFFAESVDKLASDFGLGLPIGLATIALPVGISFFTFQAISYTVDVYRREVPAGKTIDVAVYLSFFPHLVAGPIVRAREFLPQLEKPRDPNRVAVGPALMLIGMGLVKKVVIADYLGSHAVDPVFGAPAVYHGPDVLLSAYAYAAQIYCDFSGYTDIAIGLALLMGYVFPQNFDRPYSAKSLRDFWRRWHMTLSRFLRDFLYIPLGGNRGGRVRRYRNVVITMLLGGLWHGAAWTFVLWGGWHGIGLVVEDLFRGRVKIPTWLQRVLTFHVVLIGWILFRAQSLSLTGQWFARLAHWGGSPQNFGVATVVMILVVMIGQNLPERPLERMRQWIENLQPALLGAALALTIMLVGATVSSQGVAPFIYFRF
ncbi:MAG TPA: MBOAT family protein [Solirubrobacteraceae bacterium]|jgi:D-alanyl-lipoteichoic acid acyltransferase DltB (MBOAT superfamily)|nr:MBOAT family protein [Solirubrobacteraceae bacterium]